MPERLFQADFKGGEPMLKITEELERKAISELTKNGESAVGWKVFSSSETFDIKSPDEVEDDNEMMIGSVIKIEGYLSTFGNVDRDGDIVDKEAFTETLKAQKVYPLQRDHNYGTCDFIGDFTAKVDDNGLLISGEILVTPGTIDLCYKIKSKKLNTLSMGGMFKYAEEKDKKGNFIIKIVRLLEGSVVAIPANPKAKFITKSLEGEKAAEVPPEPAQVTPEEKAFLFKKKREEFIK